MKKAIGMRFLVAMCALLFTGVSYGADNKNQHLNQDKIATKDASRGALGDLTVYIQITKNTLKLAESGDLKTAKTRIKDLETAWDEAEAKMRPLSGTDWRLADKAIDQALAKLRSDKPEQAQCIEKLKALIVIFDNLQLRK